MLIIDRCQVIFFFFFFHVLNFVVGLDCKIVLTAKLFRSTVYYCYMYMCTCTLKIKDLSLC